MAKETDNEGNETKDSIASIHYTHPYPKPIQNYVTIPRCGNPNDETKTEYKHSKRTQKELEEVEGQSTNV